MNMKRVKAQIGIFITIGLILVVGFIFLISTSFTDVPIFSDEKNTYNVKEFVESCLLLETKLAVSKLGASGGWLYPKPMIYANRENNKELNKISTGFDFLDKNKMPYWFYYDDSDEIFKTYIPEYDTESQYSMRMQIKRYLDENLEIECFKGFDNFKDIYNINYDRNEIETIVKLLDREIIVELNLDLKIENIVDENTDYISNFKTRTDNKLYLPYHMAIEIVKAEINSSFMDIRVMNILRPYQSSHGRDLLPPQSETKMEYDFDAWYMDDVEKTAKQILSSEISRVQFLNTDYNEREIPESLRNNDLVLAINSLYINDYITEYSDVDETNPKLFREFKELKVTPTFEPFFPIFFRIKQAVGDLMLFPSPEIFAGFIPIFYTKYKASYEIAAPILFEIKHKDDNDDFIFNMPIEINIKHNTALKDNYQIISEDYKKDLSKPKKSLICDPSQYVSEIVSIDLVDPINFGLRNKNDPKQGVEDALVMFTCKEIAQCLITQTSLGGDERIAEDLRDTTSKLRFRLPVNCNPGTLEITKFGHQKIVLNNLNPNLDDVSNFGEIEMSSGKDLNVAVGLQKSGSGSFGASRSLQQYDEGFMIFENLDDKESISVINIDSDNQYNITINLIPGRYKITGMVIYKNEITIPEEDICYKTGIFGGEDCETIPRTELKSWLKGGYTIDEFRVSTSELLNYNNLIINFVEYTLPRSYDDLRKSSEQMNSLGSSSNYPIFSNE